MAKLKSSNVVELHNDTIHQLIRRLEECNERPSIAHIQHICELLTAWEFNYMRAVGGPLSWPPPKEERELNKKIVAICQRLIAKGQFTVDEDDLVNEDLMRSTQNEHR
jgi:hypothetical protein